MSEQPRVPAGSPEGGQFASKFVAGKSGYEYGYRGHKGNKELSQEGRFDNEEDIKKLTQRVLGKPLGFKEIAEIAGVPKGSRITRIDSALADHGIHVESDILGIYGEIVGRQGRSIYLDKKMVYNRSQMIIPDAQGQGIATEGLLLQVRSAAAAGLKSIECRAAGDPGTDTNGYYTWPRLGFVPASSDGKVGAAGKSGINLTKLMATPAGRKWWYKHGTSHSAKFDLTEGSISRRVLTAYAKAKGFEE